MRRKTKKLIYVLAVIIAAVSLFGCKKDEPAQMPVRDKASYTLCHAMGGLDDTTYLNCKEGFDYWYKKGVRYFEVDFGRTSDDVMVCLHDWQLWNDKSHGEDRTYVPDYEEFKKRTLHDKFHPFDVYSIAELIRDHDDIYIITDTKAETDKEEFMRDMYTLTDLLDSYSPDLKDRLIIQAYSFDEVDQLKADGKIKNIIFTCYSLYYTVGLDDDGIIEIAKKYKDDLWCITIPYKAATEKITKACHKLGVPVYVHTLNYEDKISDCLRLGVDGIYTDIVSPGEFEEMKAKVNNINGK